MRIIQQINYFNIMVNIVELIVFKKLGKDMFSMNVGALDRIVRVLAGVAIFYVGVVSQVEPIWWGYIGLIPFITGIIGWCPVYCPFGIKTKK